ncbi:MAG: AraC family transcriptional regulator [Luteibacter sp.]
MSDDPISQVLRLADVQSVMSGGFLAGGDWAIHFPPPDRIKFFATVRGSCWLRVDGDREAIFLDAGDVVLLTAPRGFTMGSDTGVPPIEAKTLFAGMGRPELRPVGEGGDTLHIGGHVRLNPAYASMLTEAFPPLIHVRGNAAEASTMRWILDRLVEECGGDLPGTGLATTQLAHLLFVQVLRAHLGSGGDLPAGWLRAAADPRLGPVLRLMHAEPAREWRLEQLARAAAMSRTVFATQFKAAAGVAPLTYLARWRMRLAEQALRRGEVPVAVLARDLGYASESAFSHAFKRIVGIPPSRYAVSLPLAGA